MELNHAFGLFHLARQAYERTANADSDLAPYQTDAIAAILFSVATLEAFIIELADDAEWPFPEEIPRDQPIFADQLHILLQEAEKEHANLRMKYLIAGTLLPSRPLQKSHRLYQRLALLTQLRNFIVHPKPQEISKIDPLIRRLEQEGVMAEGLDPLRHRSVISRISTRAMAR